MIEANMWDMTTFAKGASSLLFGAFESMGRADSGKMSSIISQSNAAQAGLDDSLGTLNTAIATRAVEMKTQELAGSQVAARGLSGLTQSSADLDAIARTFREGKLDVLALMLGNTVASQRIQYQSEMDSLRAQAAESAADTQSNLAWSQALLSAGSIFSSKIEDKK